MNGLEKIIAEILRQASAQADEILAQAYKKAAEIKENARAAGEALQQQMEAAAAPQLYEIEERVRSADRQARRLALLTLRNKVLGQVMAEARTQLERQEDMERFQAVWQGDVLHNNTLDAIFETHGQALRDMAYRALTGGTA